ncbi:MAG: NADH-quinone oxidoreductase subunit C [Cyclobacteriaceae bacterium]
MLESDHLVRDIELSLGITLAIDQGMNTPLCLKVDSEQIHKTCQFLHEDDRYYFDQLSSLTGIDNGSEAGTMEVIYHLYSIPKDYHLALKVMLPRETPEVDSVAEIWRTANWHEREAYDLLGIRFMGHPDLRRILLPADWEGFPLRKDYEAQEKYHGMTVKYDRDESENDPLENQN